MKSYQKKSKEQKNEELKVIIEKLETGVKQVFDTDTYKNWLNMFSKFYQYSFNNTILICMQRPDAQMCNSFTRWKTLGRHVKKGASGIRILCPVKYSYIEEKDIWRADGTKEKEEIKKEAIGFKIGYTFDVSDTEGEELPTLTKPLEESPEILSTVINQIMENSKVPIAYDTSLIDGSAYGYYHLIEKRIGIKPNLSTTHTCKTIIHELSHSMLHSLDNEKIPHNDMEIQAESVAYIVLNYFGFDTSSYSFNYVAGYSENKDIKELQTSLSVIEKTSRKLIDWLLEVTVLSEITESVC